MIVFSGNLLSRLIKDDFFPLMMEKNIMPSIRSRIFTLRGKQVILDRDLAVLYNVEVKHLKRQVTRNSLRFPKDFMFQLSKGEFEEWRGHFVTSKSDKIGLRYPPYAFTEHGVAMLSSVLRNDKAIDV